MRRTFHARAPQPDLRFMQNLYGVAPDSTRNDIARWENEGHAALR
jgi:hypothetical protein